MIAAFIVTVKGGACVCTDADDPNDHRKDCPQWRVDLRSDWPQTAYATLVEAQYAVDLLIEDHGGSIDEYADMLEVGDEISLPDGAVLGLKPVTRDELYALIGVKFIASREPTDSAIRAFNEGMRA